MTSKLTKIILVILLLTGINLIWFGHQEIKRLTVQEHELYAKLKSLPLLVDMSFDRLTTSRNDLIQFSRKTSTSYRVQNPLKIDNENHLFFSTSPTATKSELIFAERIKPLYQKYLVDLSKHEIFERKTNFACNAIDRQLFSVKEDIKSLKTVQIVLINLIVTVIIGVFFLTYKRKTIRIPEYKKEISNKAV